MRKRLPGKVSPPPGRSRRSSSPSRPPSPRAPRTPREPVLHSTGSIWPKVRGRHKQRVRTIWSMFRIVASAFGFAVLMAILFHGNHIAVWAGLIIGLVCGIAPPLPPNPPPSKPKP